MKILALAYVLVAIWWLVVLKLIQFGPMKTLLLLLALLAWPCQSASAQEPDAPDGAVIQTTLVTGLDDDRLSPGLRRDIRALEGTALRREAVDELARRIEAERPGTVVATRSLAVDGGGARVIFLVASDARAADTGGNVNTRYIVERVSIDGVEESRLSDALRDDLRALEGARLDRKAIDRVMTRVRDELPGYDVSRRMVRGGERGRLRMVVQVRPGEDMRWLRFRPSGGKFVLHEDQGGSGVLALDLGRRDWRVTPFAALGNADDLVEEYSGYGVRVQARNTGSEELGLGLELLRVESDWRRQTRQALAALPEPFFLYRTRSTVSPWLALAFSPRFHVTAGVSASQLEAAGGEASRSANAFTATAGYDRRWGSRQRRHDVHAGVDLRVGAGALQSDLEYRRLAMRATYRLRVGRQTLLTSAAAGAIGGDAPIFERFTLGDTSTLRGWDKYDIAPLGGSRMAHASVEYRNRSVAFFLDGGSVWDQRDAARLRLSAGVGYHGRSVFATLGFPLNTRDVRTTAMVGVRF